MSGSATQKQASGVDWSKANQTYLQTEVQRLRLLLQRRVIWLRQQWKHDSLLSYQGMVINETQADWLLAGEDRQAETRFYRENTPAVTINQAITEVEQNLGEQKEAMIELGTPPALEVLVRLFGLTSFERNVLVLCLAPGLDAAFERLYAYVQDDVNRKYATPHLALTLFGGEREDWQTLRNSFLPEAPLRRFRLVTMEPSPMPAATLGARPVRLDDRIADYLRGVNRPDERISFLLQPLPPPLLAPIHHDLVERLAHSLASNARQGHWLALNLIGPPEAGKEAVAKALSICVGLQLYKLNAARLPAPGPEREEIFHLLEREAILLRMALFLNVPELDPGDITAAASVNEIVERLGVFLIVASRERWQTEHELITVRMPKLDADSQRMLWQKALADVPHSLNGHIEAIIQQFDFGPHNIGQTVAAAKTKARLRSRDDGAVIIADDLWQACCEQASWHLEELAQHLSPTYTWKDIVLPEEVFCQLQEIAAQVANRHQVYKTWGFGAKLGRGRGISALFSGPSGTGKTMAAEILAGHLKLDLYRIDLAGVVSKYIGETEKNLKKVFDTAEQSGAILFFDEADALFGKRTEVKDSHDRYANIEVNYLLQRMEDYRGLAILATNRKSSIDRAFLRRLRFLVDFPFPDAASRRCIWQKIFPPEAPVKGLEYDFLARMEIPGGNIRNIAINAAFWAANQSVSISMAHIMHAARCEYAKIEKLLTEAEFGRYYNSMKR